MRVFAAMWEADIVPKHSLPYWMALVALRTSRVGTPRGAGAYQEPRNPS